MKKRVISTMVAASVVGLAAGAAQAQSNVTLYGIVDTGIGWQNNSTSVGSTSGGKSLVKMNQGIWAGSRFGLKGSEDLGGGNKAIFTLEQGFNSATGAEQFSGLGFSRQAWVGISNATYGTVTAGRQYTPYYTLLSPWSPTTWLTGAYGAHPGDIDSLDTSFRTNNQVVYTSPTISGFTFSGGYAFGGVAGSMAADSVWSVAAQYKNGPFGIGVGYQHINNATTTTQLWNSSAISGPGSATTYAGEQAVSAVNNGYRSATRQQRIGVTAGYQFTPNLDVSASFTNVQYVPGATSSFRNEVIFNTAGAVLHWKATPTLDLAAGYSYTASSKANGISDAARYHQFNLSQYYALSKRTGLYAVEAYQHAKGKTIGSNGTSIINATASIGDGFNSNPSSSANQVAVGAGIIHRF
ncbi:porin [Trinickia caryophylli]|uniref:Outer membrane protein (Porin) n=1 Tax=Trinickia caryophylli TaxID=28094 RepID=A0A1X7CH98_TRICW|nr:porin [Trinickia caryophylli]PMS11573.1 porin [Trinickia caryophylli]TRX19874.1 porin [Trinickia caryophylli]WQE12792.1 porin [Trinickia caryophylli]SME96527.1 Outer membrane protein (porin) [Trinickia caryophylli]GLU30508.1 porin [Trinickia caryophylli]